ncbi:DUF2971 domain-containing protein [Phaeobacter italicus]|uniref:DUF2971 domain-containing protein n=1 Tax=Phaeobacter italicus TaxID=481446 RepID=UPI001AD9F5B5|nr:DUF2971 domain-containing protein [Phaeobacter italicus]MBO9441486.1 DUF2971 domain-containing protein [Phaeobacter italicus]
MKRLYYFTGKQFALENLKKRHLKISFANEVNDIFELTPFDFGKNGKHLRRAWRDSRDNHAKSQGFICFSDNWNSPAMWGHYADNHAGVCYGFDVDPPQEHGLVQIKYVLTLRKFRNLRLDNERVHQEELDYAKGTKSDVWEYEREWRVYASLSPEEIYAKSAGQKLFFLPFNEHLQLREVIIGDKSPLTSKEIRSVLMSSDTVSILTARPSFRRYQIVEQKNPGLQK